MCKSIISAQILIHQTIRNFIPFSPEVHYTGLPLKSLLLAHFRWVDGSSPSTSVYDLEDLRQGIAGSFRGLMIVIAAGFIPYLFPKQALGFTCLQYKSIENTVGKGEIACNKQFLLFPQCFLSIRKTLCHFH